MSNFIIEQYDKKGHKVDERKVGASFDIHNANEIVSVLNIDNGKKYYVAIKDSHNTIKVLHEINASIEYIVIHGDGNKDLISACFTFNDQNKIREAYDCLAKIKGWSLSDELAGIRGEDNTISDKIKKYVLSHGVIEIKYTLPDSSSTSTSLY